jgi:hypothetical protein
MKSNKLTLTPRGADSARNRFAFRLLIAGSIMPGVLFAISYLAGPWYRSGFLGTALLVVLWVLWPTWIILFDAEHVGQFVFGLLAGAVLNAAYYYLVGFLAWDFREWVRRRGRQAR